MHILMLLTVSIAAAAGAQSQRQHQHPRPSGHLSPAAAAVVARFDADTASAQAKAAALSSKLKIAENLALRVEVEQDLRKALPDLATSGLTDEDRRAANAAIWRRISPIDDRNTAYLKTILPADGWFRNSRDGEQVTRNAWLIVQHSSDQAFQREIVARMAPLAKSGEVNGPDYALLYDRTEMFAGRPQRYGSQVQCKDGRWTPADLEDPANVDARRLAIGLKPMATYMELFKDGC